MLHGMWRNNDPYKEHPRDTPPTPFTNQMKFPQAGVGHKRFSDRSSTIITYIIVALKAHV
jgi:hypothetical protein